MECLNCGTKCKGAYCPTCGQKTTVSRFHLKEIAVNTVSSLLAGDNKIWRTCLCLLSRPGHMIREYLLGKRVIFGGCCITGDDPEWACLDCQQEFKKK